MPRATLIPPQPPLPLTLSGEGLPLAVSARVLRFFSSHFPRGESLKRFTAAAWPDVPIDSKASDLRPARSAFLANFCKYLPRQTNSIGRVCPQFESSSSPHDGLSSGNRPPSSASTHLHPRERWFERTGNVTLLRSIHVPDAFPHITFIQQSSPWRKAHKITATFTITYPLKSSSGRPGGLC